MADYDDPVTDLAEAVVRSLVRDGAASSGETRRAAVDSSAGDRHPSLVVTTDTYPEIRARAGEDPWDTWERRAAQFLERELGAVDPVPDCADESDAEKLRFYAENRRVFERASAAALLSILDPDGRASYATALAEAVEYYHANVRPELDRDSWSRTVYPSGVFFTLVLGLDVVRPALSEETAERAEDLLADVADWYWVTRDGAWPAARFGAYGVWAAYTGDEERLRTATEALLSQFAGDFNDGPYEEGCAYGQGRFLGTFSRNAKVHFLDVLDFASEVDLYGLEFVERAHNWLFGYARTPIAYQQGGDPSNPGASEFHPGRDNYTFGDTRLQYHVTSYTSGVYRAGKFDDQTENSAAWALLGENPEAARNASVDLPEEYVPPTRNVFLAYVLTESVPSDPDPVPSRIFHRGGAWFHEDSHDATTLAGACWNSTTAGSHSHRDTNAVHLCAYGEHVLRNAGYNGWGSGHGAFDWEYVHDRAVANNVATFDYDFDDDTAPPEGAHVAKAGAGITEGFTDGPVGYASGDSGAALAGGRHYRNFVYVPPGDGVNGYWVLFDDLVSDAAAEPETVHTALHPNSADTPTVTGDRFAATSPVGGPYPRSDRDVSLTVAYGTKPDALAVRDGALASNRNPYCTPLTRPGGDRPRIGALAGSREGFVGRYLYATYRADGRETRLATALVPHDGEHARPALSRVAADGVSGVELDHGVVTDRAVVVHGDGPVDVAGATVEGAAALVRTADGRPELYFLRRGERFSHGEVRFEADSTVSLAVEGDAGKLTAPSETAVRFHRPGLTGVEVDGEVSRTADTDRDSVEVTVPPGRHALRFM